MQAIAARDAHAFATLDVRAIGITEHATAYPPSPRRASSAWTQPLRCDSSRAIKTNARRGCWVGLLIDMGMGLLIDMRWLNGPIAACENFV